MEKNDKQKPAGSTQGLVSEVIAGCLHRLRGKPHMDDTVLEALESLSKEGKLKDTAAVQHVLRGISSKSHETP